MFPCKISHDNRNIAAGLRCERLSSRAVHGYHLILTRSSGKELGLIGLTDLFAVAQHYVIIHILYRVPLQKIIDRT